MSLQTNLYPANRINLLSLLFFMVSLSCSFNAYSADNKWQELAAGIEYQDLGGGIIAPWAHVYAFRIDLHKNKISLVTAQHMGLKNASVDQLAQHSNALISFNGGFFDQAFKPLGLRISDHQQLNPLKQISWWGVFYIKNNRPYIATIRNFRQHEDVTFAVQSGPRLLINGKHPSLKPGIADRTALGITIDGKVIVLVSTNAAMTTEDLARLMKSPPLSCTDAINLDGGSSSQLFAHIGSFRLNVHGFSNVSDALVVQSSTSQSS